MVVFSFPSRARWRRVTRIEPLSDQSRGAKWSSETERGSGDEGTLRLDAPPGKASPRRGGRSVASSGWTSRTIARVEKVNAHVVHTRWTPSDDTFAHSSGGTFAHSSGGTFAHYSGGTFAHSSGGTFAHYSGGTFAHYSGGTFAHSSGGTFAHYSGGTFRAVLSLTRLFRRLVCFAVPRAPPFPSPSPRTASPSTPTAASYRPTTPPAEGYR